MRAGIPRACGDPVRCGLSTPSLMSRNTGSPAFAGETYLRPHPEERGARLEGWPRVPCVASILRDACSQLLRMRSYPAGDDGSGCGAFVFNALSPIHFKEPRIRRNHCERSEAIHLALPAGVWIASLAHRNDGSQSRHAFATSRRDAPEALLNLPPKEGVGNAGCPLHPRPRVHFVVVERTRVTTSTPESPGVPARNGFNGFLRALPGDRAVLPPSPTDYVLSKPGWADATPRT